MPPSEHDAIDGGSKPGLTTDEHKEGLVQRSGEVTPDVGAMMYAGTLNADYISEGQTLRGDVVFDIAADDSVATVLVKASPLTEGVVVPVN